MNSRSPHTLAGLLFVLLVPDVCGAADTSIPAYRIDGPIPAYPNNAAPAVYSAEKTLVYNWTGLYAGVNGGWMTGQSRWTSGALSTGSFKVSGPLIGATLGYNWQQGPWVFGAEFDANWADIQGSIPCATFFSCTTRSPGFGTARGRVGFAWDRILFYTTAGLAMASIRADIGFNAVPESAVKAGYVAGAGVEFAIHGPWTFKAEYQYMNFGSFKCATACAPAVTVDFSDSVLRGGINVRFLPD